MCNLCVGIVVSHRCNHYLIGLHRVLIAFRLKPILEKTRSNLKLDVRLYQDEDEIWIAEIPAIPGCGSDGKSREEALENVHDAAELCIAVRKDLDMPLVVETATVEVLV